MGLMEPGCKLEDFGRLAQPAATNRLRCRVLWVVFERYLVSTYQRVKRRRLLTYAWRTMLLFYLQNL